MKKITILFFTLLSVAAYGEGYQVNLQSTRQTGMGHVGTAMKLGAESMHFNPAGLVWMDSNVDLSVGASGVFSNVTYKAQDGYKAKTNNSPSTPFYAYAGFSIYRDKLAAGLAVTTPYGSSLNWGENWRGATLVQDISLRSFVFQPTVSVKIARGLSFGAGLMVATGNFSLSRALAEPGSIPQLGDIVPVSAELGGTSQIRMGYNLGLMYDICSKFSVGVSYRSKIKMKVTDGKANLSFVNSQIEDLLRSSGKVPPIDKGTFGAELPLPSNFNVGVTFRPAVRWEVAADVQFVGWKAYDKLDLTFHEAVLNGYTISAPKDYKNAVAYRVGGQYGVTERFDVRAGVYYDGTPVRDDKYNPETPGANKLGFSAGFSFRPYRGMSIDFAFLYIHGMERTGSYQVSPPESSALAEYFKGRYKPTAFAPSIGFSYKF